MAHPDVADLLLGFCMRRPSDRIMDPSCGQGLFLDRVFRWKRYLSSRPSDLAPDGLWGVESDPDAADVARIAVPQARVLAQNFFTLDPDQTDLFDAIIGSPPLVGADSFGRLNREAGRQLELGLKSDTWEGHEVKRQRLLPRDLWGQMDARSGLHAYYFLHSARFLRESGRIGFVVPNGWLDAAHGQKLKRFLLDQFRIIAMVESDAERFFESGDKKSCLLVLEKCSGPMRRASNMVRLIRLKQPLSQLIPGDSNDRQRPAFLEQLITRLLPGQSRQTDAYEVRVVPQNELSADSKWGLALRAPGAYRERLNRGGLSPLKSWAAIRRGFTTGANSFFYLSEADISKWGIEAEFRRPVLKSMRGLDLLQLAPDACRHQLLLIPPTADLRGSGAAKYIAWGESQGYHLRRTCAERHLWYSLTEHGQAQLVLPKGIWRRHFVSALAEDMLIDQQLYGITLSDGVSPLAAAALLNSSWFALQCELNGRVNFADGVLWLAAYEIGQIQLPDPRRLSADQIDQLADQFTELAKRPIENIEIQLAQAAQQALDTAVFDLLDLSLSERDSVLGGLRRRVESRLPR